MTASQLDFLREKVLQLYAKMRPDAIGYVDAFDFHDEQLGSVLGRYDGNVYEELYKWAQQSELNQTQVCISQRMLVFYDGNVYEELYKWAQQSELNQTQVCISQRVLVF